MVALFSVWVGSCCGWLEVFIGVGCCLVWVLGTCAC